MEKTVIEDENIDSVEAGVGDRTYIIEAEAGTAKYTGVLTGIDPNDDNPVIFITATDLAGNQTSKDISNFNYGGVALSTNPFPQRTAGGTFLGNVAGYGGYIIAAIVFFVAIALLIKIFVKYHIQHPPTIVMSILVLILAGVLLII